MSDQERKVAIVGTAPSSVELAPYEDDDWEIWGCTRLYKKIGDSWDRWFEMHRLETVGKGWSMSDKQIQDARDDHVKWMKDQQKPIYVIEEYADLAPAFQPYPLDEVQDFLEDEFGDVEQYFTTSISYMLALAIYQDVDKIGLYGVDMSTSSEYVSQRPSVEYFVGLARGYGIPVEIPPQADILKTPGLYGYDTHRLDYLEERVDARKQELEQRKETAKNQRHQLLQQRAAAAGQFELMKQFYQALQNGGMPDPEQIVEEAEDLQEEINKMDQKADELKQTEAAMQGAIDNAEYTKQSWTGF